MPAFTNKTEYSWNFSAIPVIKPVNKLFADSVDNWNYHFIQNLACYDGSVGNEQNEMTRKTAVQMKDRAFNGKDDVFIM